MSKIHTTFRDCEMVIGGSDGEEYELTCGPGVLVLDCDRNRAPVLTIVGKSLIISRETTVAKIGTPQWEGG